VVGRDEELARIRSFLAGTGAEAGALLIVGEPGAGKTVLLDAAADAASQAGSLVLRATGVEFEAELPFAGLHQALLPLGQDFFRLPETQRKALNAVLGIAQGPAPDPVTVATAAAAVLRLVAGARPVQLIIDDLPWLDRASAAALGYIARRLAGSSIGFLAALRTGEESLFDRAGLPELALGPLGEDAADHLMATRFPALTVRMRRRILVEACGNPLALLELAAAASTTPSGVPVGSPAVLPPGRRVHALFASRIEALPSPARRRLLLAALDGTGDPRVIRAAGDGDDGDLGPAERARLIYLDPSTHRLAFHHPLIRSAVVAVSTLDERCQAHTILAEVFADSPDRRAWHLAESATEPDEHVASLLDQTAHRLLRQGHSTGAVSTLVRAADLSPNGRDRRRRLAVAACITAIGVGDGRDVSQLLDEAQRSYPHDGGRLFIAAAATYLVMNGDGDVDTAHRLLASAIEVRQARAGGPYDSQVAALHVLADACVLGARADLWIPFHRAVRRLGRAAPLELRLLDRTGTDPARTAKPMLRQLDTAIRSLYDETDLFRILQLADAAAYVDRHGELRGPLWRVVRAFRNGEAAGAQAVAALGALCTATVLSGDWDKTAEIAGEGLRLCESEQIAIHQWRFRYALALIAAARGEDEPVHRLTDQLTRWGRPRRMHLVDILAHHVRDIAALGQGDYEQAYQHASAISLPGTLASHVPQALWVTLDLVEAAVRTGRQAEAYAHVAAIQDAGIAALSSRLALLAGAAAAIAAPQPEALGLYRQALAIPGSDRWAFEHARVQLSYGERLRRAQATAEARSPLTAALATFERLRARPWISRAASELRATGQTKPRHPGYQTKPLTPQELTIATLAASGLTNKEIAERLYLSHRTVGGHLHRAFPKLGITTRSALRDALASTPQPDHPAP
jgi:DNA-binding CsgD family transcriptional regulator